MAVRRQTQSYLQGLFAQRGIAPRRQFGQNFLIDLNIHDLIVKAAELGPDDVVLEVGPGAGALTTLMAAQAAAVVAVDIDTAMAALAGEATAGLPNVRVLCADALASKHTLNPELLDNVRAGLAVSPSRRFKLVANLPYNVATPIISNLLVHPELCPELMVVTIQLELAERLRAEAGSEAYGALSVLVQAVADVSLVRVLPPSVFWPRPKVESAVVLVRPSAEKRAAVADLPWFHSVVRQIFLHRRKTLRHGVHAFARDRWTKADADALLEELGLTGNVRAEALNVEEFLAFASLLRERLGPPPEDQDP
ncbi:MAG: 16S rRNA (adenine(1518)-N(6)/adenine(1519)-N(6))-dimethyltransferase RsmA [Isosphaeraceae bacterium]|nr:16S rRNA (adenine(1518)-N(6)/adenine(1519)-N(6))-dimethyltransferase RsmA [Isosphaeraceae bacterium]